MPIAERLIKIYPMWALECLIPIITHNHTPIAGSRLFIITRKKEGI